MVPAPGPCLADLNQTVGPDILIRIICGRRSRLIALAASTTTSSRTAARSDHGRPLNQAATALGTARVPTRTAGPKAEIGRASCRERGKRWEVDGGWKGQQ